MKLTPREIEFKNKLLNQYKANKKSFITDYGSNAEQVMLGRAIKLAKNMAAKEDKQKIKEVIKKTLTVDVKPLNEIEEINSIQFVQNRKPITNDTKRFKN